MGLCPWRTVAPGLFHPISCLQQETIRDVGRKKSILFPILRRVSLFLLSQHTWNVMIQTKWAWAQTFEFAGSVAFSPWLVIMKETLLLYTIAVTWPIEGPCLRGALSTYVSWCRCVSPAWYPCPWACPKLHIESESCSRYLLPLPWALCLSSWSILSFSSMSCPSRFFVCLFLPLCPPPSWLLINP